jgi:rhodanese-related sulfurtransferase
MFNNIDPQKAKEYFSNKVTFTTGPVELSRLIEAKDADLQVVDVRLKEDYKKGHIPTAINIPYDEWNNFDQKLDKNKVNVIYCYSQVCHLAAKAAVKFATHGFKVMELEGGYEGWKQHKLNIET